MDSKLAAVVATTLVVCAPGYPGSTPRRAGDGRLRGRHWRGRRGAGGALAAEYHETEAGGLERLARPDAGLLLAPLPFFLEHEARLQPLARAQAVVQGGEASEEFSLVAARAGSSGPPASTAGRSLGAVGYAPRFVRGPVLGGWGELPASAQLVSSGAVLSGLRRAAAGEKVAVLLDRAQAAGLASLPYAGELEVVTRSPPLPVFVVATVGGRVPPARAQSLATRSSAWPRAPRRRPRSPTCASTASCPLDEAGLTRARRAYAAAPRRLEALPARAPRRLSRPRSLLRAARRRCASRPPVTAAGAAVAARPARAASPADVDGLLAEARPASRSAPTAPRCAPPSALSSRRPAPTRRASRACSASPASRAC